MKRSLLLTFCTLLLSAWAFAQNGTDEPCNATLLTVYSTCASVVKSEGSMNPPTFTNSTNISSGVTLPDLTTCGGFSTTTLDFWYRVVVPASGSVTILTDLGTVSATYTSAWDMAIYTSNSGTCAGSVFTEIARECNASTNTLSAFPYFQLTGQTPGATLYIRMWRQTNLAQTANRTFAIWAVEGSIAPPVTCPTAIRPTEGSTLNGDPIFEWNADPNTTSFDFIFGSNSSALYIFRDFTPNSPPTATQALALPHARIGASPFTYVTPGVTNYWYVVQKNCATNPNTNCTVLSYNAAPVPSNNECVNAIAITAPNVETTHTSASSSQSQAASNCSTVTSDNASDVWFKFRTNATGGDIVVGMETFAEMDAVLEVFNGDCNTLVTRTCIDDAGPLEQEVIILNGLPPNTTYYVRVYNFIRSTSGTPSTLLYGFPFKMIIDGNIGSIIPVELVSFTGATKDKKNVLQWQTASEKNASFYSIERSANGLNNFHSIGSIKAAGTTATRQNYEFIDNEPLPISYYRLRQMDFDGQEDISKTISLQQTNKKFALQKAFPSPAEQELTVEYSALKEGAITLNILDVFGRTVTTQNLAATEGANIARLKVEKLSSGAYFLVLSDGQNVSQMRFIKD